MKMDRPGEDWIPIGNNSELREIPDGTELIYDKRIDVWDEKVETRWTSDHRKKRIKTKIFRGFRHEYYRVIFRPEHHMTVSGPAACFVSEPNFEFPYPVPWLYDKDRSEQWVYAYFSGVNYQLWRRKDVQAESDEGPAESLRHDTEV